VWGIRAILTPSNIYYITAVDLALSMVIIFLLGALMIRTTAVCSRRGAPGPPSTAPAS
jgi:hypothetical protein